MAEHRFFRHNLSVKKLLTVVTVDEALAHIGQGRKNNGNVPLERCAVHKPDSADIIDWFKHFYEMGKMAKDFLPTRTTLETARNSAMF